MTRPDAGRLLDALESLAGTGAAGATGDPTIVLARRLLAARRGLLGDEPCPPGARRRAVRLFGRRATTWSLLARAAFDSWQVAGAPARGVGGERLLRLVNDVVAVDVEIRSQGTGRRVWVAVEGLPQGGRVRIETESKQGGVEAPLDATDSAALDVAASGALRVLVLDEQGMALESPWLEAGV